MISTISSTVSSESPRTDIPVSSAICGNASTIAFEASATGQNTKVIDCEFRNCDSEEQFFRNIDVVNRNDVDLVSPSYRSINSVSEACGNTINGAIRRGIAGPLKANDNIISIDFDLGASTRGAIALDAAGVSNKGSTINGNTITNNSPQGFCIRIQNQNSETGNVIYTSNHCGLGSIKTISDLSTGSVGANNIEV